MRRIVTALALAAAWHVLSGGMAAAQKSPRYDRLMQSGAPTPSRSALARKSWVPGQAAGGIVSIATPVKSGGDGLPNHRCTGVLLSPQHVLASGFCVGEAQDEAAVVNVETIEVYTGARIDPGSRPSQVAAIFRHPTYDPMTFRGDLAILKLAEPVKGAVAPVVISQKPDSALRDVTNVGWMQDSGEARQTIMRMAVPLVSLDRCEHVMRDQRLSKAQDSFVGLVGRMNVPPEVALSSWKELSKAMPRLLSSDMLCAGPADGMPCDVDNGALMFAPGAAGGQELVGVFTSLEACEVPGIPAVYTRVAPYAGWIRKTMGK